MADAEAGKAARQHAHDVRNQLNSMELGMTLISDLSGEDADVVSTLGQMRQSLSLVEASLKSLVRRFSTPHPTSLPAWELVKLWQPALAPLLPADRAVEWIAPDSSIVFWLDGASVGGLLRDMILTIFRRNKNRTLRISFAASGDGHSVIELREPSQELPLNREFVDDIALQISRQNGRLECLRTEIQNDWIYRLTFPTPPPLLSAGLSDFRK